MKPIIEVKNLGKKYNITHRLGGYIALRDVIANAFKSPLKFLRHKAKKIIGRETKEEFWALKDINFSIEPGEAVGIIGANGAGKSTLLKILTGITPPTTGEAILRGKVASLLEVGTGFHPELTGHENILLNGAILGMPQKEIIKKFDDIVEFSGVGKFLDTPVKYYSSGMYVRLAFSVAAHMEPDILLVDEVLAVGDADFQKKCLGKMDEVTKAAGRTILFVSHNMDAISKLCQKTILLENGQIKKIGGTKEVVAYYLQSNPLTSGGANLKIRKDRRGGGKIKIVSFHIEENSKKVDEIYPGGFYTFCYGYETANGRPVKNLRLASAISTQGDNYLIFNATNVTGQDFKEAPPKGIIRCEIRQKFPLADDLYNMSADLFVDGNREDYFPSLLTFEVKKGDFYNNGIYVKFGSILTEQNWSLEEIK